MPGHPGRRHCFGFGLQVMHGASGVASGRVRLSAIAQVDTGNKRPWYDEEQQQRDGLSGAKRDTLG